MDSFCSRAPNIRMELSQRGCQATSTLTKDHKNDIVCTQEPETSSTRQKLYSKFKAIFSFLQCACAPFLSPSTTMPQCANKAAERSIASIEVRTSSTPKAPANDPHSSFQEQVLFICYALIAVDYGALETLPASLFSDITEQLNCSEMETSYLILGRTLGYCGATFATAFVMDKVEASHRYYSTILMLGVIATVVIPIVSEYYVQIMLWAGTCT